MSEVTTTDGHGVQATQAEANADNCGCCLPPPNTTVDKVERLMARRAALDERLARLELVGASR